MKEPTTHMRAQWANSAISHCVKEGTLDPDGEMDTLIVDLIANLLHLAEERKMDVDGILESARNHWAVESTGV